MTQNVAGASLSALLFSLLFLLTLKLDRPVALNLWLVYGVCSGITVLFIPTALLVLPFLLAWLLSRDQRGVERRARGICAAIVTALLLITPWLIRNYATFHQFVPIRSGFGLALYWGNHPPRTSRVLPHPNSQATEMNKLRSQGEMSYMAAYQEEAISFISQHRFAFVQATARRLATWWIGPSWGGRLHWFNLHRLAFYPLLSAFAFSGLALALRSRNSKALPFLIALLFYPLVYYLTEVSNPYRFRLPIEPVMVVLGAVSTTCMMRKLAGRWRGANERGLL